MRKSFPFLFRVMNRSIGELRLTRSRLIMDVFRLARLLLTENPPNQERDENGNESIARISQNGRNVHGRRQDFATAVPHFTGGFCERIRTHFFQPMAVRGPSK